jgi:hypothetical protein
MQPCAEGGCGLAQQPPGSGGPCRRLTRRRRYRRASHRALAQGRGATGTAEFMQLTSGQHQQEPFADWLGATAFRAVEFARGKGAKLLRHFTLRLCA